jgi:hypothetical protein
MKNEPHPLELIGDMASLLFAGVTQHDEMWAAHLQPILRLIARRCEQGGE